MSTRADEAAASGEPLVPTSALCRFLRCKSYYGASEDVDGWRAGTSSTEVYWCLCTMESFGPDDGFVHASVCRGTRSCCRKDAE